jgi:predicted  nucleic acid-binding Zn-ribbon protein
MSLSRNDKQQNDYLRVILEEIRALRTEVKKLEVEIKDLKKQIASHNHHPPVV